MVIEPFRGPRSALRPLFTEADDSPAEVESYLERIIGHVQLLARGADWEIKSIAVIEAERGRGVGAALVRAALRRAFGSGAARVRVATASADIGNLRFYQRLGFRMIRVEPDAFTPDRGYPILEAGGIPVRDRVWFSIDARAFSGSRPARPRRT
jgi:GNAT superfamily N-acetyltransferase